MASNPFVGGSYNLDSRPASVQRTINMMPVPLEPGNERTGYVFKDAPGLTVFDVAFPGSDVTWDPLIKGSFLNLSNGNLTSTSALISVSDNPSVLANISKTAADTGAYYWEIRIDVLGSNLDVFLGVADTAGFFPNSRFVDAVNQPYYAYRSDGSRYGSGITGGLSIMAAGDIVGIAWRPSADRIWFSLNGVWLDLGNPAGNLNPALSGNNGGAVAMSPGMGFDNQAFPSGGSQVTAQFSELDWVYTAPSGFTSL